MSATTVAATLMPCHAIGQLHYLLTAFWLSVWIPVDWVLPLYHFAVFFLLALVQRIVFVAGGCIGDETVYWGWSLLSTACGVALGYALQMLLIPPLLLSRRPGFEANAFVKAPVLTGLLVAAQIFYGKMPPSSGTPWGLILTTVLTGLVVGATWAWSYDEPWSQDPRDRGRTYVFFAWWVATTVIVNLFFFLGYTTVADQYVALIAFGGTLAIMLLLTLAIPHYCCSAKRNGQYARGAVYSEVTYTAPPPPSWTN